MENINWTNAIITVVVRAGAAAAVIATGATCLRLYRSHTIRFTERVLATSSRSRKGPACFGAILKQ